MVQRSDWNWLAAIVVVVLLAGGTVWLLRRSAGPARSPEEDLELARRAMAATERLDPVAAKPLWERLREQHPEDISTQQNVATNAVLRVVRLVAEVSRPDATPEEIRAAREQVPEAISAAQEQIDRLAALKPEDVVVPWMRSHLDALEARLAPPPQDEQLRRQAAERLLENLRQHPEWVELAGPLVELADQPGTDDLAPAVAEVLLSVSEAAPRNLYLALEAGNWLVREHDPRAVEAIQRSAELSEPLREEIAPRAAGLDKTPAELASAAIEAIEAGNWQEAELYAGFWKNIFSGTAAVKTDLKAASPNLLDFVSLDVLRELTRAAAAVAPAGPKIVPQFRADELEVAAELESVRAAQWFDFDLDGDLEIAAIAGDALVVLDAREPGAAWQVAAQRELAAGADRLAVADLFVVDASVPDRLRKRQGAADLEVQEVARSHDTYTSLVVGGPAGLQVFRANPEAEEAAQRLLPPERPTGLESVGEITAITAGDVDADGDLDLILATSGGVEIWINRGNMTFYPVTEHSQMPPADSPVVDFAIGDFDRDLDLDVLTASSAGVGVLENLLHQQFRWKRLWADPASAVTLAEIDGNASWDAVAASEAHIQVALTETPAAGRVLIEHSVQVPDGPLAGVRVADLNNDGWLDLVAYGPEGIAVVPGAAGGEWDNPVLLAPFPATEVSVGDVGGDGALDLLVVAEGRLRLLVNETDPIGNYLRVRFKGIDDNLSGRVNHYAIGSTLELRYGPHYRAAVITDRTTHFGMGPHSEADTLRAILTNGVTQVVLEPEANQTINEQQELKGSCPYLYSWDGERFAFVTDCLWAAPLGLQVAQGRVAPDRPWEYLKVPGRYVAPKDGFYELRITEELWEVAYFDHLELTAVDHPADVQVYTNEKVGPPSIAAHEVYALDELRAVVAARDQNGRDVTDLLAQADRRFVTGFDRHLRQGLVSPHLIELDFGDLEAKDRLLLVLTGWILPTDTSLNIAIDQNPDLPAPEYPSVWVPDADGNWQQVVDFMGFPGGKTKTIVVDLTDKLLSDDHRIQIRTSAQIYWDRAAVAIDPPPVPIVQHAAPLVSAELGYHGFSALLPRQPTEPHRYDYDAARQAPRWPPLDGPLTRYGDVRPLLEAWDDAMVVMGAGDEIRLRFRVPEAELRDGWQRDFVLHCVGWDKDADLNTLAGQSIGPLPFRAMETYPPPARQWEEAREVHRRNAVHRTRQQRFRDFWRRFSSSEAPPVFVDGVSHGPYD